jgi:hypothetical protein
VDTWSATLVTYRVEIDHVAVRTLTGTTYRPLVPDGDHRWRIVTTDARGQETVGVDRFLRVDTKAPSVRVALAGKAKHGAVSRFVASVADPAGGSGLSTVEFDFGDGTKASVRVPAGAGTVRATHRYAARGRRVVRATAEDAAGNRRTATARVKVK